VSKGFGSYGDILIRDRKMYVVPTPFRLLDGVAHKQTLVLPADVEVGKGFFEIGHLERQEAAELIVGYSFSLKTSEIVPEKVPNPDAGREHLFRAWRLSGSSEDPVSMRPLQRESAVPDTDENLES
jgi:hypothetical protein